MTTEGCYIMRDQVRDLVPSLMKQRVTGQRSSSDKWMYGFSVVTATVFIFQAVTLINVFSG